MVSIFGYYNAPTRAAGQGKWNFFRGVGVCFGLPLPDFLAFFVDALVVVVVLAMVVLTSPHVCRIPTPSHVCRMRPRSARLLCLLNKLTLVYIIS
jgi:hypothetical protein